MTNYLVDLPTISRRNDRMVIFIAAPARPTVVLSGIAQSNSFG
jgi:hypothetical protein